MSMFVYVWDIEVVIMWDFDFIMLFGMVLSQLRFFLNKFDMNYFE